MALELRPTFSFVVPESASEVVERLQRRLASPGIESRWSRTGPIPSGWERIHVLAWLTRRRIWSPWLHLDIRPHADGTELFGRFSPHPSLWTAYALTYLALATVAFLSTMFALSQLMMNARPTAAWGVLACAVVAVLMWWASQVGQRLAAAEMQTLRNAVDHAVEAVVPA